MSHNWGRLLEGSAGLPLTNMCLTLVLNSSWSPSDMIRLAILPTSTLPNDLSTPITAERRGKGEERKTDNFFTPPISSLRDLSVLRVSAVRASFFPYWPIELNRQSSVEQS